MRTTTLAVALCVLAGGTAWAQNPTDPVPPPSDPPPPVDPPPPPVEPPVRQQPDPSPPPIRSVEPVEAADPLRPDGMSVGIGVGYIFPTSLETPNVASVRFRLANKLTVEPQVSLAQSATTVDVGESTTDSSLQIAAGALIRKPLVERGRVDLEVLGAVNLSNVTDNPDMEDNNTTTTQLDLAYGLAVNTWINRHLQISMSALNPIVSYTRVREEQGPDNVVVTSNRTIGAIFDPTVILMIHLYH